MWELAVIALLLGGGVVLYNRLVRLRTQAEAAWADIDVQLKRRHDLIPNLVETVKGYASHEKETLERVIAARSRAVEAESPADRGQAEGLLSGALRQLFALSESYPQLQASENFQQLQRSLSELEGAIQQARRYYNAVVRDYNTAIQSVPTNLVARSFSFEEREFFEIPDEQREAPRVDFG